MNSKEIYQLLETINNSPKKTDKIRLLQEADCPELRRVLVAAYDPKTNYFIKKIPVVKSEVDANFDGLVYQTLDCISSRVFTGNGAISELAVELKNLNVESQELLSRIILRDLRCGISAATINKAIPGLIKEYPYMQYSLFNKVDTSKWDWKQGIYAQIKLDGMYASINHYSDGSVVGLSRQGTELPEKYLNSIYGELNSNFPYGYQYQGEILVIGEDGFLPREVSNGLMNSICKGGELPSGVYLYFIIWDMIPLEVIEGSVDCKQTYRSRFIGLASLIRDWGSISIVKTKRVHSLEEAFKVYQQALAGGEEGIMLKDHSLLWKDHKTTKGVKLKLEVTVDLEIIGFTTGKGKNANTFGAVSCQSREGLLKVDVSGFSDEMRLYTNLHREELLGTIMSVSGNDLTKIEPASIFLPRFKELRTDKTVADSLEEIQAQFELAKMGVKK